MRQSAILALVAASALTLCTGYLAAQGMAGGTSSVAATSPTKDIIETATGPGMADVTTLVTAVKAAGLVDTLKGKGPFTVFAPTNAAFAKLPKGTLEDLLKPENKDKLVKILTYHVVAGDNDAKAVMEMKSAKSVEGDDIMIMVKDGKVMVGNDKGWATVIKPDIKTSNGTIHWIDTVIMP
jgi:uncharacterized surface protein with fasciclin (FAS1) repeats